MGLIEAVLKTAGILLGGLLLGSSVLGMTILIYAYIEWKRR